MGSTVGATTTGLDLKVERIRAGVTQLALAARMGRSRWHVGQLEAQLRPSARAVERYRQALEEAVAAGEIGMRL